MSGESLAILREQIYRTGLRTEEQILAVAQEQAALSTSARESIARDAAQLVTELRRDAPITFLQSFLTEYGLTNNEGVALMCLAEAFLRVPDVDTLDRLIGEKLASANWHAHAGQATAFLVNASTWGLMLSGRILSAEEDQGLASTVQRLIARLGEPVIRIAMTEVMEHMGEHFVIGETIQQAVKRSAPQVAQGYCYSYDMLGEAVRTDADARRCFQAYSQAIAHIATVAGADFRDNPGISVKLSALHPRFELLQKPHMFDVIVGRVSALATAAAAHNIGFTIDAEEAERLDITLDIVEAILGRGALKGWDGLGVVVQAYSKRALAVIDWLQALARQRKCRLAVRLVKGAYWDTEIKRAQVAGLEGYPVFTRKAATDVAYLAAARSLLGMQDIVYPQFATHNAHTLTAVLAMARAGKQQDFELQRLHGMGETLHHKVMEKCATRHRIYAPVGHHRDLLAYLVRRLLENGANNSFVHQIRDHKVPVAHVAADPFTLLERTHTQDTPAISPPGDLFATRRNSPGWDLSNPLHLTELERQRAPWRTTTWHAAPIVDASLAALASQTVLNPALPDDIVGQVQEASAQQVLAALDCAQSCLATWFAVTPGQRADYLRKAAEILILNVGEVLALLTREAGKTVPDALGEWREAIDFLRYYAAQVDSAPATGRGVIVCISPWNFPLAIFTGQIAAALAAGNVVVAKPAEQTPLIAWRTVQWLHEAGIPGAALQLLPGDGGRIGKLLCADARVQGVCFTGSLETARVINQGMAEALPVDATLIAETGGQNAMIVDSTALPEQTIRDVIMAAFNSSGQRCSALRILYLQEEIAEEFITMLKGAMDALHVGDPWSLSTDIGPIIDAAATAELRRYLGQHEILHQTATVPAGNYIAPSLIRVSGIGALRGEVFGPVLHVATFAAAQLPEVIAAINNSGYGLTFAIHSRLMERVDDCVARLDIGNVYVNRNQIGAVVGSQPFGGSGLSGTGPKAGGPHYLPALQASVLTPAESELTDVPGRVAAAITAKQLQSAITKLHAWRKTTIAEQRSRIVPWCSPQLLAALASWPLEQFMPGPTGEENHLSLHGRGCTLCLGPQTAVALQQALQALAFGGCALLCVAEDTDLRKAVHAMQELDVPITLLAGSVTPELLVQVDHLDIVAFHHTGELARQFRKVLARRPGKIVPLVCEALAPLKYMHERHVCTDTTAAGGNVALMAAVD